MLLVKTKVGPSLIPNAGTGLFADEFIPNGTPVWKFDSSVDEAYTKEEAERLPEPKRTDVLSLLHSYISKQSDKYILSGDDAKYMNHSPTPNVATISPGETEDEAYAARDISPGEEITVDYTAFAKEGTNF